MKRPVLAHRAPDFVGLDVDVAARDYQPMINLSAFAADLTAEEAAALRLQPGVRYVEAATKVRKLELSGLQPVADGTRNVELWAKLP